jgi:hypothetical protein
MGNMKDCRSVVGGIVSEYAVSVSTTVGGMVSVRSSRVEVDRGSE